MPIQSPPRRVSDTENMLRLLSCVDALGAVNSAQLWTFAAEQELMDYVTMRLCLHDLLEAAELEMGVSALRDQLLVTDRGREALRLFADRLPGEVRERIARAAPEFRARVLQHRQVSAIYESASERDYRLLLTLTEGELPSLRVRVTTNRRALARRTIHRFEAHAAEALLYLYALAEQAAGAPGDAEISGAVTAHSVHEFTARVALSVRQAAFEVELLLPTREAAEAFVRALRVPGFNAEVAQRLAEMLCGLQPGESR